MLGKVKITDEMSIKIGLAHEIDFYEYPCEEKNLGNCIVSIEALEYSFMNIEKYYIFQDNFYKINMNIRNGVEDCDNDFDKILDNSPGISKGMTVYKGVPREYKIIGEEIKLGYLFSSTDDRYALDYALYDTSYLYDHNGIRLKGVDPWDDKYLNKSIGTLFRIKIPKGIKYFLMSNYEFLFHRLLNEMVFGKQHKIIVTSVGEVLTSYMGTKYRIVDCDLF